MADCPPNPTVGLLLSGGLDSAILLEQLLAEGQRVQPFYVRCGLVWEPEELRAVRRLLAAKQSAPVAELVVLDLPLADLYGDHWSTTGRGAPDAASDDSAVYLPGRNPLLVIKPALWCAMHGIEALALGVLGTSPFADARTAYLDDFSAALGQATGRHVRLLCPLANMTKCQVMDLGRRARVDLTFSCIAPTGGTHCGRCNKCAERRAAFRTAGITDPTAYALEPAEA